MPKLFCDVRKKGGRDSSGSMDDKDKAVEKEDEGNEVAADDKNISDDGAFCICLVYCYVWCMNLLFLCSALIIFVCVICLIVGVEDDVLSTVIISEDGLDDYKADNNASKNNSAGAASLPALKTIFDCEMIIKGHKTTGKPY